MDDRGIRGRVRLIALALCCACGSTPLLSPVEPPRDASTVIEQARRAPADPLLGLWRIEIPGLPTEVLTAAVAGRAGSDPAHRAVADWIAAHPDHAATLAAGEQVARLSNLRIRVDDTRWIVEDGEQRSERRWNLHELRSSGEDLDLILELATPGGTAEHIIVRRVDDSTLDVQRGAGTDKQTLRLHRVTER